MPKMQRRGKNFKANRTATMTDKQLKQCAQWQGAISFGHFMDAIMGDNTHHGKHIEKNLVETMDDELHKVHGKLFASNNEHDIPSTSTFDEHLDVNKAIEESIQANLAKLARWHEYARDGEKFSINVDMNQKIGTGFRYENGSIREYNTDVMSIVLEKASGSKYGIELTTAYPNIKDRNAKPTGGNLTSIVEKTDFYKTLSENPRTANRANILLALAGPNDGPLDIKYEEIGIDEYIHLTRQSGGQKRHITIDCNNLRRCSFHSTDMETGKSVTLNGSGVFSHPTKNPDATHMAYRKAFSQNYMDIYKECPDECRLANRIQTYLFPEEMQPINQKFRERMEERAQKKAGAAPKQKIQAIGLEPIAEGPEPATPTPAPDGPSL